jgi:hypothetical protein
MKEVYIPKTKNEKAMQRALLQYRDPMKYDLVYTALVQAGREDLIGFGPKCLIKPREKRNKAEHSSGKGKLRGTRGKDTSAVKQGKGKDKPTVKQGKSKEKPTSRGKTVSRRDNKNKGKRK